MELNLVSIEVRQDWWASANQMFVAENIIDSTNSWPYFRVWLYKRLKKRSKIKLFKYLFLSLFENI